MKNGQRKIHVVEINYKGYDFYIGTDENQKHFYNIVKHGNPTPAGGYYNREFIEKKKGIKFPSRFHHV